MKKIAYVFAVAVVCVGSVHASQFVCDKGAYNEFGVWDPCPSGYWDKNAPDIPIIQDDRIGKVRKVYKNLDGSVTVWRYGTNNTEEWRQSGSDTWERSR